MSLVFRTEWKIKIQKKKLLAIVIENVSKCIAHLNITTEIN